MAARRLHPSAAGQRFPPAPMPVFPSCYSHGFAAANPDIVMLPASWHENHCFFPPLFPTPCFVGSPFFRGKQDFMSNEADNSHLSRQSAWRMDMPAESLRARGWVCDTRPGHITPGTWWGHLKQEGAQGCLSRSWPELHRPCGDGTRLGHPAFPPPSWPQEVFLFFGLSPLFFFTTYTLRVDTCH